MTASTGRRILRALTAPLRYGLALLILFEEWGWEPLRAWMARLARLPLVRQFEAWVRRLPPWAALPVFLLPGALLLPVKIGALWLIGQGQRAAGLMLIVAAKVAGTAIAAWLFELTRPALMSWPWFAALLGRWVRWKESLLIWVRASMPWRIARVWRRRWRGWLARFR